MLSTRWLNATRSILDDIEKTQLPAIHTWCADNSIDVPTSAIVIHV